jgi:hypothetical protein
VERYKKLGLLAGVLAVAGAGYFAYRHYGAGLAIPAVEMVQRLPAGATTILYVDVAELRKSPLLAKLRALAPAAKTDVEYSEFVRATGFDYERDLDRAGIALVESGGARVFYASAEGRFDAKKIAAFALKSGKREMQDGHEVFTTTVSGSTRQVTLAFLGKESIVLTDSGDLGLIFSARKNNPAVEELAERARRLAGSPVFAVLRPDRETLRALAARIPRGLRSDQLAALVGQLRWITIAARPDGERTRIVIEGESISEDTTKQIAGLLEGLLLLARIALDDPKSRARMDPAEYAALSDLLTTAEVTKLDRGETKSVRLILSAGPKLLNLIENSGAQTPVATGAGSTKK